MSLLQGIRILVTRARHQASDLADRLRELGAEPIVLPAIEIVPPTDLRALDEALQCLERYDWVVFTSINGVRAVAHQLGNREELARVRLAAVGPATATELARLVRYPDLVPTDYAGSCLGQALGEIAGQAILLPRGDLARRDVVEALKSKGARVTEIEAYRTVAAPWPDEPSVPDLITFTSSSGVLATHERLAERGLLSWLETKPIVCIGPITARTVADLGYRVAASADKHTIEGLTNSIVGYVCHA